MPQSIPCFMSTFQATLFTIVNCISTKSKINKIQIQTILLPGIVFHFCKDDLKELDKLSTNDVENKS